MLTFSYNFLQERGSLLLKTINETRCLAVLFFAILGGSIPKGFEPGVFTPAGIPVTLRLDRAVYSQIEVASQDNPVAFEVQGGSPRGPGPVKAQAFRGVSLSDYTAKRTFTGTRLLK